MCHFLRIFRNPSTPSNNLEYGTLYLLKEQPKEYSIAQEGDQYEENSRHHKAA